MTPEQLQTAIDYEDAMHARITAHLNRARDAMLASAVMFVTSLLALGGTLLALNLWGCG